MGGSREPSHEQVAYAVSRFTRRDLAQMRARMKTTIDELRARAADKKLPFRVRRAAGGELRVRLDQRDLYGEIAKQMRDEGALTVGDLGELAVARLCGYGADSDKERD